MWYWIFYLLTIIESIDNLIIFLAICAGVLTLGHVISSWYQRDTEEPRAVIEKTQKKALKALTLFITLAVISCLIPTKKDVVIIIAGGTIGNFVQGDSSIQALPADVTRYLHNYMLEIAPITKDTTNKQ